MRVGAFTVGGRHALAPVLVAALLLALTGFVPPAQAATGPSTPTPGATTPKNSLTPPKTGSSTPKTGSSTRPHGGSTTPTFTPLSNPAATPPMGWDSWDSTGCGVTQHNVVQAANWLVATGLRDAGYRYVIVDDCWYNPTRAADGSLRGNPAKFPNGMHWLGWFLHSHGLLFGLYASAGISTCAQLNGIYPGSTGSLGHEQQDAQTFASWGVDYLKYDYCSPDGTVWQQITALTAMRDALRATKRPIVYSINPNSFHLATGARNWGAVANVVRVGEDLAPFWDMGPLQNWYAGIVNAISTDEPLWHRAKPGIWNDPDSLVVGLQPSGYASAVDSPSLVKLLAAPPAPLHPALALQAMQTNFAMWAMMAAPLIIGAEVPYLSQPELHILLNPRLIAVDQDPLGHQGHPIDSQGQIWVKPLAGGALAAAFFNASDSATTIATNARRLGLPSASKYQVTDLWYGVTATTKGAVRAIVPAHGAVVVEMLPIATPPSHKRAPSSQKPASPTGPTTTSAPSGGATPGSTKKG